MILNLLCFINEYIITKLIFIYFLNLEGIFEDNNPQFSNIPHILVTLEIFHFDISGNDDNDSQ